MEFGQCATHDLQAAHQLAGINVCQIFGFSSQTAASRRLKNVFLLALKAIKNFPSGDAVRAASPADREVFPSERREMSTVICSENH